MGPPQLKRRLADLSLRSKLMLLSLSVSGMVIVILTTITIAYTWTTSRQELMEYGSAQARVIADNLAPAILFQDKTAAGEILDGLRLSPDVVAAGVYGLDQFIYLRYGAGESRLALPDRLLTNSEFESRSGHLRINVPIEHKGERYGSLQVVLDTHRMSDQITAYVVAILATALLALLVGTILSNVLNVVITSNLDRMVKVMRRVSEERDYSLRITDVTSADEVGFLAQNFNAMLDRVESHDKALGMELDERQRTEEQLYRLAHTDALTQLPNRQFFNKYIDDSLAQIRASGGRLALMFIDLDNFKSANDTFGHQAGDELLHKASTRLRQAIRGDDVVCRLGGDEFAMVIKNFHEVSHIAAIAEKVIAVLSAPFRIEGYDLFVGASIGIALAPDHATHLGDLVRSADTAMYQAKANGKNRYFLWQPSMGESLSRRFLVETHLRKALYTGELEVFFQSVHDMSSRALLGAEALLRWNSRELGHVPPVEFIPIAEECGLIQEFGFWVMDQVCKRLCEWRDKAPHLFIAVNLSARQFADPLLADRIAALLDSYRLPHHSMELEITESLMLDASPSTLGNIERMKEFGLSLALDDFGTGYSSLSYLSQFPISKIKIDRGFVANLGKDEKSPAIIHAIIGLARSLGMRLQVEGVETQEQHEWLHEAGCEMGQGYLYSRPISAVAMDAYLNNHLATQQITPVERGESMVL